MNHYNIYIKSLLALTLLLTLFSCDDKEELIKVVNPNAQFSFEISAENPYSVEFTSKITDRDSWQWDFGDGETSALAHPTHIYTEEGEYIVSLTALGESGSTPHIVEQEVIIELFQPTATFTYSVGTDNPLELKFTASTEYATAYTWDFGDGSSSTEKKPTHEYAVQGDYNVTLTVTGFQGTTPAVITETVTAGIELVKIEGIVIGHESSWGDNPDTYVTAAFDGNMSSFVDSPNAEGFVGYDFGEIITISLIKYAPRDGQAGRMVDGEFRGSNDPDYLNTYDVLYTIADEPASGELTEVALSATYRYIYFYSTNYCNISELEFYSSGNSTFVAVDLENADFSLPGTDKQTNWENVPGWATDTQAVDSGVEDSNGNWIAYRMSSDPTVYQLTNHTITSDEEFKISVKAWDSWNSSQFTVSLYYDTGDGTRIVLATQTYDLGSEDPFELITMASPDSIGAKLGVMFDSVSTDGGDGWCGFDNVELFAK